MARTEAQKEWRKTKKRILIQLEVTEDTKALWDAYARQMGVPTGRMVRICVERCIAEDGTADVSTDQPTSSDVQNGREMIL